MTSIRIAALLAAACSCSAAWAATDCPGSVTSIMVERAPEGPSLHVTLNAAADFVVDGKDDAWARQVAGLAGMAKVSGQPVVARFAESGLRCEGLHARADLVSFSVGNDMTTTRAPARPDSLVPTASERR